MRSVPVLQKQLAEAEVLRDAKRRTLDDKPDSLAARLSLRTLEDHIAKLREELRLEWQERAVEVLRLRLVGDGRVHGSVPLSLLSRLSQHLGDALHAGAQKRKTGRRVRRVSKGIVEELSLSLVGLAPGSTVLSITGSTAPDLFGYSILNEALKDTFSLLHADADEEFAERVASLGIRGAGELREFLSTLERSDLQVELSWLTPDEEFLSWVGTRPVIHNVITRLGTFESRDPEEIRLTGRVITLSLRGRFEIEAEGQLIAGTFPERLLETIQLLHVGEEVTATLERATIVNTMTKSEKVENTLLDIASTRQEDLHPSTEPS